MNHGYMRYGDWDNPVHNEKCPICDSDIYVYKCYTDFGCVNKNCSLFHGARYLKHRLDELLNMLNKTREDEDYET